jgi:hypothetical protein
MPVEAGDSQEGRLTLPGHAARSSRAHFGARPEHRRPGHAGPPAQEPHLLPAPLLRLPHQPHRGHLPQSRPGPHRSLRSQLHALRALPQREEKSLEDFIINRFGKQLYLTFFKSYTEKVWGVPCNEISAEWGAQRIKGLSLKGVVLHFMKKTFGGKPSGDIAQKKTETSLIEKFLYPKFGPGQLWEHAADLVRAAAARFTSASRSTASTSPETPLSPSKESTKPVSASPTPATTSSPPCRSAIWSAPSPPQRPVKCPPT